MASKSLPWVPPATAAIPSAAEVGDRKSAFMKIASAMHLIAVVILEGADRLQLTLSGHIQSIPSTRTRFAFADR